jgi:hypothetical protein
MAERAALRLMLEQGGGHPAVIPVKIEFMPALVLRAGRPGSS